MTDGRPLDEALEELVLGAPRRYTRVQVSDAAGLDLAEGRRLWRSLGFPEAGDEDVLFTEQDVEAVRLMSRLTEAGILEPDVREAVARAVAQSMSRLAEWQVGMLMRVIEGQRGEVTPQGSLELAAAVVPGLEELQTYVWRRHLAAAVRRMVVTAGTGGESGDEPDTWPLVVGFADMVGPSGVGPTHPVYADPPRRRGAGAGSGCVSMHGVRGARRPVTPGGA